MITSTYIVIIYSTRDQVLICNYCYQEKLLISQFFFYRNKGYVIPVDTFHFFYLFGLVKFHMMYLFSSILFNLHYHFLYVHSLVLSYSISSFLGFPLRDQTCLITLFLVAYKQLNS